MDIQHQEKNSKGSFFIEQDQQVVGEMTYSRAGEKLIIIDHTEVGDVLRGTGAGKKLVLAAVSWARENDLQIMPLCPFAKSVFERNPELGDVLKR
ncbi:MAG: N-acetyltransferase [Lunatimonas sp.]|uniref:GNAT family N-acetyltransferase n=1 Tax=Lunatimonas sp. TaxID=2060141 RepID=UPI00263A8299|nr:GNAT family N-acetyltransferase [Lunatimonas sp.]MCC5936961.1 N-acetyltransferase [Lunatimonas sp.]